MRSVELGKVGKRIREIRKNKKMNLQEVAEKSQITAGLLSRIENFRTLPSLPVLHKISIALDVPLSDLVEAVGSPKPLTFIHIKKGQGEIETRDDSRGLTYEALISESLKTGNIMVNRVVVAPQTFRPPVSNDSMELLHMLKGNIEYGLKDSIVQLEEGDTLFFDGRIPHSVENRTSEEAIIFKVYLHNQ